MWQNLEDSQLRLDERRTEVLLREVAEWSLESRRECSEGSRESEPVLAKSRIRRKGLVRQVAPRELAIAEA